MSEDTHWRQEVVAAAKRVDVLDPETIISLSDGVCIDDLDDWCATLKRDYPCLFKNNVRDGL